MKAGIAKVDITPEGPVWMSGYAARDRRSEGVYHNLFAKALVLDNGETQAAIVTTDLIGFDEQKCDEVKERIQDLAGFTPDQVILSGTHTHTGPEIEFDPSSYNRDRVNVEYSRELTDTLANLVRAAAEKLEEVTMDFASAPCTIAVNRRLKTESGIKMRPNPAGITDPVVSVLRASREDGTPLAILMSYPCHPTTLGDYLIGGDYPGYAQDAVEEALEGCTAMFMLGCAGDQKVRNVDGRGGFRKGPFQVAQSIGEELGRAVLLALGGDTKPVEGLFGMQTETVSLPLQPTPSREEFESWLDDKNRFRAVWAKDMIEILDSGENLINDRSLTVQVLNIGSFVLVTLSAEICVGYSLRLKSELAPRPVIISAFTNGMIGYIPTEAMVPEGGYEVDGSYFYHSMPAPYAAEVEETIVANVNRMVSNS